MGWDRLRRLLSNMLNSVKVLQGEGRMYFPHLTLRIRLLRSLMTESKNVQILHYKPMRPERTKVLTVTNRTQVLVNFVSAIISNSKHKGQEPGLASLGLLQKK